MAVAYVTSIAGTASSLTSSASVDLSERSAGDLALVVISRTAEDAPSSVPSGWSLIDSMTGTQGVFVYAKVLAAGDLTTLTWSFGSNAKTHAVGHIYSGHDTTSPIASVTHGVTTWVADNMRYCDFGSLTTDVAYITALGSACNVYDSTVRTWVSTNLVGLTERYDAGSTASDICRYVGDLVHAGGTFAPSASTTFLSNACGYVVGFLVAINPAGTSPPTVQHMTPNRGIW